MTQEATELTPEQVSAEEDAAFAAGYTGSEQPTEVEHTESKATEPEPAAPAAETDPFAEVKQQLAGITQQLAVLPKFEQRLKSAEGVVGAIRAGKEAAQAATSAGHEAPSKTQIEALREDPEEWKQLKTDFPEWATGFEKRFEQLLAAQAAKQPQAIDPEALEQRISQSLAANVDERVRLAEQRAIARVTEQFELRDVASKHPDWEQIINTPEFSQWGFSGGPTRQEVDRARQISDEIKAGQRDPQDVAQVHAYLESKYPMWWTDRGAAIYKGGSADTIKTLDLYKQHAQKARDSQTKTTRLANAAPVKGSGASSATALDDDAAFEMGFKS